MEEVPQKSYKVKEVAEMLGCTGDNVYKLIKYGNLKAFRVGPKQNNLRITDIDIKEYIENSRVREEELHNG